MTARTAVYSAGDVAVTPHLVDGRDGIYATYPNAMLQARNIWIQSLITPEQISINLAQRWIRHYHS